MNRPIAVVNTGASSLKFAVIDCARDRARERARIRVDRESGTDMSRVVAEALDTLEDAPAAFGHRFVHGGSEFVEPVTVTAEIEAALEQCLSLAPLHNGIALAAIREVRRHYPDVPSVAVFDTAFHAGRPAESMRYALPGGLVHEYRFRRYGFHGIAHASLVESLAEESGTSENDIFAVTLQLGAGCSACAVRQGRSVETSMGFTPLEGLVMATRSGNVDPAIVLHLMREGFSADRIENELTQHSGLRALSGSDDVREILVAEARGEPDAKSAIDLFCHRIILTAGAYLTLLEGQGALVFGGGIGTNSPQIRERVAAGLSAWDVELDAARNASNEPGCISARGSRPVYVFDTDEETVIARAVAKHLDG